MQCYTCSKWVHLNCSLLSFSKFSALDSSHTWSCPTSHVSAYYEDPQSSNTVTSSPSGFPSTYTFTFQSVLSAPTSANAAPLPPHFCQRSAPTSTLLPMQRPYLHTSANVAPLPPHFFQRSAPTSTLLPTQRPYLHTSANAAPLPPHFFQRSAPTSTLLPTQRPYLHTSANAAPLPPHFFQRSAPISTLLPMQRLLSTFAYKHLSSSCLLCNSSHRTLTTLLCFWLFFYTSNSLFLL